MSSLMEARPNANAWGSNRPVIMEPESPRQPSFPSAPLAPPVSSPPPPAHPSLPEHTEKAISRLAVLSLLR